MTIAYALLPSQMADPSVRLVSPILVQEGQSGYWPTGWVWKKENAEYLRDQNNARLGVSPAQADRLLGQSLFPRRRSLAA